MPQAVLKTFYTNSRLLRFASLLVNTQRSRRAIRGMQDRKFRAMVDHAYRNVPFYRERYRKAGITPDAVQGLADLLLVPTIAKDDLSGRHLSEILAAGVNPAECRISSSSGTTGTPLTTYQLPLDMVFVNLGWKRAYLMSGMRPHDRIAVFIGRRQSGHIRRWHERFGFFPQRDISNWLEPSQWVDLLRAWQPRVITGSVMTLRILSEYMRDQKIADVRPRLVLPTSELLDDASRCLFSQVFGCRVIDLYGSEEVGCIAWECRTCDGYHVAADMLIVEVLKDGRPAQPGEQGEIVVTNLHSRAMPFIRYRQGDVATVSLHTPRCGSPFPLISSIEGRTDDFLILRNGRRLPPHPFYHCIDPVSGIKSWRIIQETAGTMRLELLAGADLPPGSLKQINDNLAILTQGQIDVEMATVDEIPVTAGVKFRRVSSRVGTRFF
jgi:phenylacetate-CoA ligase